MISYGAEKNFTFLLKQGDYSHLDRKYVNHYQIPEYVQDEVMSLIYKDTEEYEEHDDWSETFPVESVGVDTKVIVIGFLP